MGGSETFSNERSEEGGVHTRQKGATKISTAKSSVIVPPQSVVMNFGDGTAAILHAIRTGGGEEDRPDTCNTVDIAVDGGNDSAVSIRVTMQKIIEDGDEEDDILSNSTVVLPCHDSDISKGLDENPNCNLQCAQNGDEAKKLYGSTKSNDSQLKYVKPVLNNVNGSVIIPSDVVKTGSLPYSRTLYGYFIGEEVEYSVVNHHIRNIWKPYGIEDIMMNRKGFYFFKFSSDQGMLDALENGPWTVNNVPIFLKKWTPGLIMDKSKIGKLPVWIKIYDMPLELWNMDGLSIVASMLGNPLAVDTCTKRMCMNASGEAGFARVLVDVNATGNWADEISVSVPYGNGYSLSSLLVEYNWKPAKCSVCNKYCNMDSNCIRQLSEIRLKKEKEAERRYKAAPHLYTIIKVARDADLSEQIGKNFYFDLVDHDKVRSFYIQKHMPFNLFKEEVAKEFGVPVQFQRFWMWAKRQNHTYRPYRSLTPKEETKLVEQLMEVSQKNDTANANADLNLFLEIEIGPDLHPLPPPDKSEDDILLFFKLYDPEKEELRYVGRFYVKGFDTPTEIISKLNEIAGFSRDEEIELYEEIKFEPVVMCERLDRSISFRASQIRNGDIICFQKISQGQGGETNRYLDFPSFMEYVNNCRQIQN